MYENTFTILTEPKIVGSAFTTDLAVKKREKMRNFTLPSSYIKQTIQLQGTLVR